MRRFGRRRRASASGEGRAAPIDAERWLGRIKEEGLIPLETLEPVADSAVPGHVAAIGRGTKTEGGDVLVAFAPRHAGDALLGALAAGTQAAESGGFTGEAIALAPQWSGAARRRLALVRAELPFSLTAVAASNLQDAPPQVQPEIVEEQGVTTTEWVAGHLAEGSDRELFNRAAAALEGLASKHGGATRAHGRAVELVILTRRVAQLRIEESGGLSLVTLAPQRSVTTLDHAGLAAAFDALEGQLRKRLADRRIRDGEEGIRTRLLAVAAQAVGLRGTVAFPVGGSDTEAIDQVGVDETGRPVVVAARLKIGLSDLGRIIDAVQDLRPHLSTLLADVPPPVRLEAPRLVLVAEEFDASVAAALAGLSLAHDVFTLNREGGLSLTPGSSGEAGRPARSPAAGRRRRKGRSERDESSNDEAESASQADGAPAAEVTEGAPARATGEAEGNGEGNGEGRDEDGANRNRRRRRRGGRSRGRDREDGAPAEAAAAGEVAEGEGAAVEAASADEPKAAPRYESLSLLDLDDNRDSEDEDGARRRRGGRGRRRGRRAGGPRGEGGEGDGDDAPRSGDDDRPRGSRSARARGEGKREARGETKAEGSGESKGNADALDGDSDADVVDDAEDLDEALADLPENLAGVGDPLQYAEEDDDEDDADESREKSRRTREREERRRARKAQTAEVAEPPTQRRRAVVVANADRDSLLGAVLLARDIRFLEGLWVYPQADLMTFFRSVATGVKDDVPIYLVGFTPSPARDVIQAASLYANRITWFDHHDWPPEDLQMVRESIADDALHLTPGVGSSLPSVLETCTRRSRFSDKLVDLATGRFTQHDYERWGRLWWHRLGEIAEKGGEVRADIDALLSGRPSDLAKEALRIEAPPRPVEVEYVSSRDFRLVRFAGYAMVVVDIEAESECDPLLAARIARERYRASLSLAYRHGSELVLFGGEETGGRRTLDFGALGEHLANKFAWVEALPDTDHVARFRVRGLDEVPGRLDEVVGTIAMGRSILEG